MLIEVSSYPIEGPNIWFLGNFTQIFLLFHSRENLRYAFNAVNVWRKTEFERAERRKFESRAICSEHEDKGKCDACPIVTFLRDDSVIFLSTKRIILAFMFGII